MQNSEIPFCKTLQNISNLIISSEGNFNFIPKNISANSKDISKNSVFVAIKGEKNDGHNFIPDAISSGASAVVFESVQNLKSDKPIQAMIQVSDSRKAFALLLEAFYDFPAKKLKLIGVTGTNGKTSCAFILQKIFNQNSQKCGLISTVQYSCDDWLQYASRTTPTPELFQKILSIFVKHNCTYAAMELSSHGLDQNRIASAKFAAAIFTNLSGDHLDYHLNMENYYQAKKKLFTEHLDNNAPAVINIEDQYGKRLAEELKSLRIITCSFSESSDYKIEDFKNSSNGMQFIINSHGEKFRIYSPMIGRYNAMNITQCFAAAKELGIKPHTIVKTVSENILIPGRLEKFILPNGATAYVDYAHSDDALEKVLKELKERTENKLICVFGCGGNRDKSKRPRMGAVAAKFADITIVTSDNPRNEDPDKIIQEIVSGIPKNAQSLVIPDRREAIKKAVQISSAGDVVLIAGKGHETGQQIGHEILPFDDREEIRKFIC